MISGMLIPGLFFFSFFLSAELANRFNHVKQDVCFLGRGQFNHHLKM